MFQEPWWFENLTILYNIATTPAGELQKGDNYQIPRYLRVWHKSTSGLVGMWWAVVGKDEDLLAETRACCNLVPDEMPYLWRC